jgi:hypothetical protein
MDTFEALLEAIEQYAAAAAEYKSIAEKVPYERDYYCHREIAARDRAKMQLKQALDLHIRGTVAMKEVP